MASQYEAGDSWTVKRLRSTNAVELNAAYRGSRLLPPPSAIAYGPRDQILGANVGVSEYWVLDTAIPAVDMCWVVVQAHPLLQSTAAPSPAAQVYWYPQGNNSLATAVTPPAGGPGANVSIHLTSSAGTYPVSTAPDVPTGSSIWLPLDPANTVSGIATSLVAKAGSTPPNATQWSANLSSCRMLGYPTTVWDTGALWEPLTVRGS